MRRAALLFILLPLLLLAVPPAFSDSGGPDPSGYTYIDNEEPNGPIYFWEEISGLGQPLGGQFTDPDNGYAGPIMLGFPFPYYGQIYDRFYVYVNGYIQLAGPGDSPGNGATLPPLPNPQDPNALLAPFSTDLYMHPDISEAYYHYDATSRRGILEFSDLQWCCGLNTPHTFEIILYPDGHILMQYQIVRFRRDPHIGYVAGIEGPNGQDGLGYAAGFVDTDDTVHNNLAVLYIPGPDIFGFAFLDVTPGGQCEDPGQDVLYYGDITNLTGYTTTFSLTYAVSPTDWPVSMPAVAGPITNTYWGGFPITVSIPISASFDDSAQLWVTATAAMSPSIVATDTFWVGVADRDLILSKGLVPNIPPAPGGLFRYALTVDNGVTPGGDCGAEARSIVLTDTLPSGMDLVDVYPTPVTTPTDVVTWTLGVLAEGTAATFYVEMRVPTMTTVPTYLSNTAGVHMTGTVERGPFENNYVSFTTVVTEPWLDLWALKFLEAGTPIPGTDLAYRIEFANGGNVPVEDVVVTDTLPAGTSFVTATAPFSLSGDQLVWYIDHLDNQPWVPQVVYATVHISDGLPNGFTLTNVVEITSSWAVSPTLPDIDPWNNRDALTLTVQDLRAEPWVEKYLPEIGGVPVIPEPGGDYSYWIHVGNSGAGSAITVTLTDTLPMSTTAIYADSAFGAAPILFEPGLVHWNIPALGPGLETWVRVTVLMDESIPNGTVLTNSIFISNVEGFDITPTNNFAYVTSTLLAADVTITKTAIPTGEVATGENIIYVLHYSNVGELDAIGITIEDLVPDGLLRVGVITSGPELRLISGTTYLWELPDPLGPGEGGDITITAWVEPSFAWPDPPALTNTARISTTLGEGSVHAPNEAVVVNPVRLQWYIYLPLVPKRFQG
jgi:uncharacterized repeat protein (TIGR01451 family)